MTNPKTRSEKQMFGVVQCISPKKKASVYLNKMEKKNATILLIGTGDNFRGMVWKRVYLFWCSAIALILITFTLLRCIISNHARISVSAIWNTVKKALKVKFSR